jgi:hypothetical protein
LIHFELAAGGASRNQTKNCTPPDARTGVLADTDGLVRLLLASLDLRRHQADVIHVGGSTDIDDVSDISEIHIVVAADEHHTLGAVGVDLGQPGQQIDVIDVGFVDLI